MLRASSKKAIENVRRYIYDSVESESTEFMTIGEAKDFLLKTYINESVCAYKPFNRNNFKDWASGLPSVGSIFDYYYLEDSRTILMDLLEETKEEAEKYTRDKADSFLSNLIWLELNREEGR